MESLLALMIFLAWVYSLYQVGRWRLNTLKRMSIEPLLYRDWLFHLYLRGSGLAVLCLILLAG